MATETVHGLNRLIETCIDGKNGYEQAGSHANNPQLKQVCQEFARQRDTFASELQQQVRALGGDPTTAGSTAANLHRAWIGLKDALTGGDEAIVRECIRGDESAVKEYQEVLSSDDVPPAAKTMIARQHGEVEQALARMNTLKQTLQ